MSELSESEKSVTEIANIPNSLKPFIVLSSDGQLDRPGLSTSDDVAKVVGAAIDENPENGLVIYWHGGLDDKSKGVEIVESLKDSYHDKAATYPIFFVWKSGFGETLEVMLKRRLALISREKPFRQLKERIPRWSEKYIIGSVHEAQVVQIPTSAQLEADIGADISNDREFQETLRELFDAARGADAGIPAAVAVRPDKRALDEMFPAEGALIDTSALWLSPETLRFLGKIAANSLQRIRQKRTHGFEPTVVEEILSAMYLESVGAGIWDQMKAATERAFAQGAFAGTALLAHLKKLADSGRSFKKITLIGHSAGAIYISNFIKHASVTTPDLIFDVIFFAPAITHKKFAELLRSCSPQIRNFRMFSMLDACESKDELVQGVYTRSLLYFISGVLERDELQDKPLVGMQRFLAKEATFNAAEFPDIDVCRQFLAAAPNRTVWSVTSGAAAGLNSEAKKHGGFASEDETKASVVYVLTRGFGP